MELQCLLIKNSYKLLYTELPNSEDDEETLKGHKEEGRLIVVEINNICYILTYVPNSGVNFKCPLKRLDYRINSWDVDMFKVLDKIYELFDGKVIWFGDLNVARTVLDIENPRRQAGFTIEERKSFEQLFKDNKYIDVWRELNKEKIGYTYKGGWRLDYFIISDKLYNTLKTIHCSIENDTQNISDHYPLQLLIEL